MSGWEWAIPFVKECIGIFLKGMIGGSIVIGGITIALYIIFGIQNWFESINKQMR